MNQPTCQPKYDAQFTDHAPRPTLSPERYAATLARQEVDWPIHIAGAKRGNPFATLCSHCYGRHRPPKDVLCPNNPPGSAG